MTRGHESFCTLYLFIMDYILNFLKYELCLTLHFFFRTVLGYIGCGIVFCHLTNFLRYSSWHIL